MKYFALVGIVCVFLMTSCNSSTNSKKENYTITVLAPDVHDGVRAYLKSTDAERREVLQDSAIVFDGQFQFTGHVDEPELWFLAINGSTGFFPVIMENTELEIKADSKNLRKSSVTGSKANEALMEYFNTMQNLSEKQNQLLTANQLLEQEDAAAKSKLASEISELNHQLNNLPLDFIKKHPDNYFSLTLLESLLHNPNADIAQLDQSYQALDKNMTTSAFGKRVGDQLEIRKIQLEKFKALNVGQTAPEFSAPDAQGNMVNLRDIRGKVTIIDFWASWCGPCRRENPNVVKTYQKYHDKGLEIIGVSLDRANQKDKWLQAIADDKLDWHHVSHLNYFNDPVAKLYNIQSIPATYILDASGTIVAKNLRGEALEKKISELLDLN